MGLKNINYTEKRRKTVWKEGQEEEIQVEQRHSDTGPESRSWGTRIPVRMAISCIQYLLTWKSPTFLHSQKSTV